MKTIFLNGSMNDFITVITNETNAQRNVRVAMHGYKAIVYANSPEEAIRRDIGFKLRAIAKCEFNLNLLRGYVSEGTLSKYLAYSTPEDVSELCLEEGLVGCKSKAM